MKKCSVSKRHFNRIIKNQLNNLESSAQSVLNQTHFVESSVVNYVEVGANINASSSNIISNNSEISSSIPLLHNYADNENYNNINNDHLLIDSVVNIQKDNISISTSSSSSDEETFSNVLANNLQKSSESTENIFQELHKWSIEYKINHNALKSLLTILRKTPTFKTLPKDPRTFLMTPKTTLLRTVTPGLYNHFGILNSLNNIFKNEVSVPSIIKVSINIDGLPLSKSSNSQLYPILGMVKNYKPLDNIVFPIGIYHGNEKPSCFNNFLEDFVTEAIGLYDKDITVCGKKTRFEIQMLLFDAVAKASVLQIKGHSGYSSCSKCTAEGEYLNGRMCFPDTTFIERTDNDFKNQTDENHHVGQTILTRIPGLNLVSAVPLDYMHLILLGVMKKLLVGTWIFGKPPHKLPSRLIDEMSTQLISLKSYIPCEFSRKPRSLKEAKRFKATEFRLFLLYLGPIVLKDILDSTKYDHFITLHYAISILVSNKAFECQYVDYAEQLLKHFVVSCGLIYNKEFMIHNIHNLLHISNDVRKFGPLDVFSNFPFENFLGQLKKLVRKSSDVLPQIVRRLSEIQHLSYENFNKNNTHILTTSEFELSKIKQTNNILSEHCFGPQFEELIFPMYKLTLAINNRCCKLKCNTIIEIFSFGYESQSKLPIVIGKKYLNVMDFFKKPNHSSLIGIHFVSELNQYDEFWHITEILTKLVRLPLNNKGYVVFPLLHI